MRAAAIMLLTTLLLAALLPTPAFTQTPATAEAVQDARAIARLIAVLEDDTQREQLLAQFKALQAALPGSRPDDAPQPAVAGSEASGSGERDGLVAIINRVSDHLYNMVWPMVSIAGAIGDLPGWVRDQFADDARRSFWLTQLAYGVLLPLFIALFAHRVAGIIGVRALAKLPRDGRDDRVTRLFCSLVPPFLELLKITALLVAGYAALVLVPAPSAAALQLANITLQTIAMLAALAAIAGLLLNDAPDRWRLIPLQPEAATQFRVWFLRLGIVAIVSMAMVRAAMLVGAGPGMDRAAGLVAALFFVIMSTILIWKSRRPIASMIRGSAGSSLREGFAAFWHLVAIAYVFLAFGVYVSASEEGLLYLLRGSAITIAASGAGIAVSRLIDRVLLRYLAFDPARDARFPGLRERADLYRLLLKRAMNGGLAIIVFFVVLDGWDFGLLEAVPATLFTGILNGAGNIGLVLILCITAWELSSSAIARMMLLDGKTVLGSRARTLLPLLRRSILLTVTIVGGLMVLAELGMDITPLLAGAGVLGLAIGFGSQSLVRDIITGFFILVEDTIAVGDVVSVGGHTGIVEDLSIRTIRLRDLAGTVHTVPFGDVTAVENMTKDFSYALLDVGVGYGEDTDAVCRVLEEVYADLDADESFSEHILEPIEIMGVNDLADSAVVIRARIKTKPVMQWGVRREFFRRMKRRFDELEIEIPFPHRTLYFAREKDTTALAEKLAGEKPGAGSAAGPGMT